MKNLIFFGLIILIMFNSCIEDSALSDLDIVDPSLITLEISLERAWGNDSLVATRIKVLLRDKNFDAIELQKGSVSVNGHIMQTEELVFSPGFYYTIDNSILKVEVNELYTFVIELADGKQYEASITTQDVDLYELNLPSDYNKINDMEINWQGHDIQNEFEISLNCIYTTGAGYPKYFYPDIQERTNGSYLIPNFYFNEEEGIYEALVSINSKKYGTIDSSFRDYSEIYSSFNKASKCDVN